jgi:hypothetical protein
MALWKIEPSWKKSVIERQFWHKEGQTIIHEIGWRWGEFFIETEDDKAPNLEAGVDMFDCGYECDDWSTDDGCWEDTEFENVDNEEELELFLEENSVFDLEEEGWVMGDCEMIIDCDLIIEKVKD